MSKEVVVKLSTKYKSPVKNKEFKKYWKKFIDIVGDRDNFNESHLKNLEVLCGLYVEYDRMTAFLEEWHAKEGTYSYVAEGRHGVQIKTHPELNERNKLLSEIRQYSRLLGIILNKDSGGKLDDDSNEWEV